MSRWSDAMRRAGLSAAFLAAALTSTAAGQPVAPLPRGVRAVWDLDKARWETAGPTRDRVCLNGLWRWQPAKDLAESVPAGGWGHFKVPGFWPGHANYIQEDCQTL